MALRFRRGTTQTLWSNYLAQSGEEPATITGARLTIRHYNPITELVEVDVNEAAMTYDSESLYYYRWAIPADAQEGNYTVEYEAIVDSVLIESVQCVYIAL